MMLDRSLRGLILFVAILACVVQGMKARIRKVIHHVLISFVAVEAVLRRRFREMLWMIR